MKENNGEKCCRFFLRKFPQSLLDHREEEVTRVSLAFDQTTLAEMLLCTRKAVFPSLKADDIVLSCYGVRGYSSSLAHDRQ